MTPTPIALSDIQPGPESGATLLSTKKRWRLFVDGEHFAIRAAKVAKDYNLRLMVPGTYYVKDAFVWMPNTPPKVNFLTIRGGPELEERSERAYYFTAVHGDVDRVNAVRDAVRGCAFECNVFKKRDGKSKRVDVAMTSRMLVEAARDTYDVAVLIAGDEDYVPLVEAVKEMRKAVYLTFFEREGDGLSDELKRASDTFFPLTQFFCERWDPTPVFNCLSTGTSSIV